jgi:hypothetical protein
VQLRKILATDFHGFSRIKNLEKDIAARRVEGAGWGCGKGLREDLVRARTADCAQSLHRKCRKAVGDFDRAAGYKVHEVGEISPGCFM